LGSGRRSYAVEGTAPLPTEADNNGQVNAASFHGVPVEADIGDLLSDPTGLGYNGYSQTKVASSDPPLTLEYAVSTLVQ
jgi:hypothetical protein